MKPITLYLLMLTLCGGLLLTSCGQVAATQVQPSATQAIQTPTQEIVPASTVADTPTTKPSPTPTPFPINISEGDGLNHELVFAIHNAGHFSGEAGQPAWLGWGADNLAVAPDGSFWIADTPADPDRLLHYSPQGDLLATLSMRLGEKQYWARDLAVDASGVWVLDYISQPQLVLHLNLDGSLQARYPIPQQFTTFKQEDNIMPGLWHIPFVVDGKVILDGPVGIVELTVTDGTATFKPVSGYDIGGHVYTEVADGLTVDDLHVKMLLLQPEHFLNYAWLLGAASDGSFYVRMDEGNNDQGKSEPPDRYVRRYSPSGDLLGIALLPLPELARAYDVALGPDGNVYAMYSRTDHSVEILRLRFSSQVAPLLSPYTKSLQPAFKPLLPSEETPATDADAAREAMLAFYAALAERRYDNAASLYGGSYESYTALDDSISADQPGIAWQNICQMEFCLAVSDILDTRQVSPDEYEFLVGFVTENGIRFDYSICCGDFEPIPNVEWFVYSLTVKKIDGQWRVMGAPLPLP